MTGCGGRSAIEFLHAIPFDQLLIQTVNGIVTGMILALVASGLTLIFGIMDVVNFAHGELFMLGAYVGATLLASGWPFWLAALAGGFAVGVLGIAAERLLREALLKARGNRTKAAALMGVSRRTLHRKIAQWPELDVLD